jgi:FKBP-type peptidyl-prolyl cis-trans isomerase
MSENELTINIPLKGADAKVENGVQVSGHYEGRGFDGTVFDS